MTPKEKAIELIDKFKLKHKFFTNSFIKTTAKECALIAVDEILNSSPLEPAHPYDYVIAEREAMEFWQKVKQEIENL